MQGYSPRGSNTEASESGSPNFRILQKTGPAEAPFPGFFPEGRRRLMLGESLAVMRALPGESFAVIYADPPFFTGKERAIHESEEELPSYGDDWDGGRDAYLRGWRNGWRPCAACCSRKGRCFPPGLACRALCEGDPRPDVRRALFSERVYLVLLRRRRFQRAVRAQARQILYYAKSAREWKFYADRVREPYKWTDGQPRADGSARDYTRGKLPDDVWEHHAPMPWAVESLGYPTQKPEALLERLLLATRDEGDAFFPPKGFPCRLCLSADPR